MKKGRHRRFEEARALKRTSDSIIGTQTACVECGAAADEICASWCLARVLDDDEEGDDYADPHAESEAV